MPHPDPLPLYQTISIVNVFLLTASLSMVSYAVMETAWMRQSLTFKTYSLGMLTFSIFAKLAELFCCEIHSRSEIPCKICEGMQKFMTSLKFF